MTTLTDFLDARDPFCDRGNRASSPAQKLRQLGDIHGDPSRFILVGVAPLIARHDESGEIAATAERHHTMTTCSQQLTHDLSGPSPLSASRYGYGKVNHWLLKS